MLEIEFAGLSSSQIYHLMTQVVIPRPVAWVLSENLDQSFNLAPFSYFNAVCSDPPMILLSLGRKPDGSFKDTRVNIEARQDFVVHIAHRELLGAMNESSRTLPYGESEVHQGGLKLTAFAGQRLPRLADCRIAMACRLEQIQEIGNGPQTLIFGRVLGLHLDDQVVETDAKGRLHVCADRVDPIGRLGASEYTSFGEILRVPRPD